MKAYFDKLKFLFLNTKDFFKSVDKEKSYWDILKFYIILVVIVQIVSFLVSIPLFLSNDLFFNLMSIGLVSNIALSFVTPFIAAAIFNIGVLLYKGKGGYINTFKPTAYSLAIFSIYGFANSVIIGVINWFIPPNLDSLLQGGNSLVYSLPATIVSGVISFIALVHFIYAIIKGICYFQKLNVGKALVSVILIPVVITLIIGIIFGAGIAFILNVLGY